MIGRWFFTLAPAAALLWLVWSAQTGPWDAMRVAGFLMIATGCLLNIWARLTLGNSFSVLPQARKLVTGGIYSVIRHPVYVTGMMALAGLCLYLAQPRYLLLVAVGTVLQHRRSRKEEAVLEAKFGQQYRDYRARTWF